MALTPALTELCDNPNDVFFEVCNVLLSYADNILRHPNVEKYRSIPIGSPTFSSKLLPFGGAVECLFEMGFEESDTHLVFSKSASLERLKVLRESIAAQRDQRLHAAGQQVDLLAEAAAESPPPSNQAVSSLPVQPSSQVGSKNFCGTLQSNFQRVLLYENTELQQKARSCIPYKQLLDAAKQKLKFAQEAETECQVGEEDFLVLELLRWFKHDFFSWVDCLPCSSCGGPTQSSGSLSPTIDELRWGAQRVENHYCQSCQLGTRFPRYNNPEQLLKTRRGRCGEWANCFTLCCRALRLEARYIWDSTDHVWTEVYSVPQRRWLHCDPCENICDQPLLYEVGWGKKLSYILAFSQDQVVDVTWRYSCKHPEVLSRRTDVEETWLLHTIIGLNALRQQSLGADRKLQLAERLLVELVEFISPQNSKTRPTGRTHLRVSGLEASKRGDGDAQSGTIEQGTGYVFTPTDKERRDKLIHVSYNTSKDQYCRISNDFEIIHCWDGCAWNREAVFRKVENDWQMVYIARIEGSSVGQISWKFDFGPAKLSVKSVSIRASSQTFSLGEVSWLLQSGLITTQFSGDGSMQSFPCLNSSSDFTVTAQLRGGEGNASWQHAQLFRQSLRDTEESPFEVIIHLENT